MLTKIKEVTANFSGNCSLISVIPKVYVDDKKIKKGDKLEVFRTTIENRDGIFYTVKPKGKK